MFRNRNRLLNFQPRDGMQVVVRGQLGIYEARGEYQLVINAMEEAGAGALRRAFEELKSKLQAEGLFDSRHKQQIPDYLHHVGVITSRTGAALRDILTVFRRRFPAIRLTLFPVAVQGSEAAGQIVNAIATANSQRDRLGVEALIVGRGGGSLEDLQAFNEESVARAISASKLPITSAVGHQTDFTISDFVADLRAATPSAAAELMSPDQQELRASLAGYEQQLSALIHTRIDEQAKQLNWLCRHLRRPDRRLQDHAQTLDRLEARMQRAMGNQLHRAGAEIIQRQRALHACSPRLLLTAASRRLHSGSQRLETAITTQLQKNRHQLEQWVHSLNAVSPLQVLARGYSITCNGAGDVVRSSGQVQPNDRIHTTLASGSIHSVVTEVNDNATDIDSGNSLADDAISQAGTQQDTGNDDSNNQGPGRGSMENTA